MAECGWWAIERLVERGGGGGGRGRGLSEYIVL